MIEGENELEDYILFQDVCKYYQMGDHKIAAVDHVSFSVSKGEFCVIVGASGERVIIVTGCINALVSRISGTLFKNNSCIA